MIRRRASRLIVGLGVSTLAPFHHRKAARCTAEKGSHEAAHEGWRDLESARDGARAREACLRGSRVAATHGRFVAPGAPACLGGASARRHWRRIDAHPALEVVVLT